MNSSTKYIFYLHGRIVEVQGADAVSDNFGKYEYKNILKSFKADNVKVISEVRPEDTKVLPYAHKVVAQIEDLLEKQISPNNISVIGASKGSIIAMQVSTLLRNKNINYIFVAGAFKSIQDRYKIDLYGNILGFYEASDSIAGMSYKPIINNSTGVNTFKEIKLTTNLGHGIVFKPLEEWVEPAKEWINNK